LIGARTSEGRARAKAREAIRCHDGPGQPMGEIARSYDVSYSTISRLVA
jgi:hypothetical protein